MTDIYDRGRALAIRMLAPRNEGGKGLVATLTSQAPQGDYVPGEPVKQTGISQQVSMVRTRYESKDIDGQRVLFGDARFLVSPVDQNGVEVVRPLAGALIDFNGDKYITVQSDAWNYAGVSCGFVVQGRPA